MTCRRSRPWPGLGLELDLPDRVVFESWDQGALHYKNVVVLGDQMNTVFQPEEVQMGRARGSEQVESQMVTWDGDQVLQLLLQVHDVVAQLNVIHPGETGHRRQQVTLKSVLHPERLLNFNKENVWEGVAFIKATHALCRSFPPKEEK